jgi:hypothetical protein
LRITAPAGQYGFHFGVRIGRGLGELRPDFYYFRLRECLTAGANKKPVDETPKLVGPNGTLVEVENSGGGDDEEDWSNTKCTAKLTLTNKGGMHLSSDEVNMVSTTKVLLAVGVSVFVLWALNWIYLPVVTRFYQTNPLARLRFCLDLRRVSGIAVSLELPCLWNCRVSGIAVSLELSCRWNFASSRRWHQPRVKSDHFEVAGALQQLQPKILFEGALRRTSCTTSSL